MRVALVVNGFPVLSESFIYNQAAALQAVGVTVTIVAVAGHGDPAMFSERSGPRFDGEVRHSVFSSSLLEIAKLALPSVGLRSRRAFDEARQRYGVGKRALKAWLMALPLLDHDVVHVEYSGLAVTWLDALKLLSPTKIVVSCRGTAERITPHTNPKRALALRAVFDLADRVHCVSQDMVEQCKEFGLASAKAFVNRPAVDTLQFSRSNPYVARSSGSFELLSTGRLVWAKGLEFALLAIRKLIDLGHDVKYTVIGAGPDEDRVKFAVHDLRLEDHVTMTGRLSAADVRSRLERCDLYLLPSVSEGISNAALEAMSMGVPVVATRVGGMPEAITDGVDGVLVPSRDPAALAARIAELLGSTSLRERLSVAARTTIERDFTLDRQVKTFMAEYEALR